MRTMPGSRIARTACILWVVWWPAAARAYRPFDSTDAAVAERGDVEVELGPVGWLAEGAARALVAPSLVVNWGCAERWEAVLEGRGLVSLAGGGTGPTLEGAALSLKRVLREGSLQGGAGPSLALEVSALLPGGDGERGAGGEAALIASRRWRDLTVHLDGAAAWTRAHQPAGFLGLVLEGHDAWAVRPVGEAFVERERGRPAAVSGLAGAIWRVSEALSLDAAVRRERSGGVEATELRLGLTWAFAAGIPR